jgi:hypothetical protein
VANGDDCPDRTPSTISGTCTDGSMWLPSAMTFATRVSQTLTRFALRAGLAHVVDNLQSVTAEDRRCVRAIDDGRLA